MEAFKITFKLLTVCNINWPFDSLTHTVKCIHLLIQQQSLNPARVYLLKNADVSVSALQNTEFSETPSPDSDSVNSLEGQSEPSWFKDIKFDDSDTEQLADEYSMPSMDLILKIIVCERLVSTFFDSSLCPDSASPSKRTSVSSFHSVMDSDSAASINLNMEQNNVNFHIKKQSKYPHVPAATEQKGRYYYTSFIVPH